MTLSAMAQPSLFSFQALFPPDYDHCFITDP
jgi:hypothetical protein